MLKSLGITAIGLMIPKLVDKISDSASKWYDSLFESPSKPAVIVSTRKPHDTTKFTQEMAEYIIQYHTNHKGTGKEHTEALNQYFGLNKSNAAYARIWSKSFNIHTLPKRGSLNEQK